MNKRRGAPVETLTLAQLRAGRPIPRHIMFTTDQAPGAWPNGSRVHKVTGDPGDVHPLGALATVLGSLGPLDFEGRTEYGYFVRWDDMAMPVFVVGRKLALNEGK